MSKDLRTVKNELTAFRALTRAVETAYETIINQSEKQALLREQEALLKTEQEALDKQKASLESDFERLAEEKKGVNKKVSAAKEKAEGIIEEAKERASNIEQGAFKARESVLDEIKSKEGDLSALKEVISDLDSEIKDRKTTLDKLDKEREKFLKKFSA